MEEEPVVGDFTDAAAVTELLGAEKGRQRRKVARKERAKELTPRNVTSAVWACYNLAESREGEPKATIGPTEATLTCRFCNASVQTGGNSSNCLRHMRSHAHKDVWHLIELAGKDGGVHNAARTVESCLAAQKDRKESFFKVQSSVRRAKAKPGLYRKEAALVTWAVDKNVPFHAFSGQTWERVQKEMAVSFAGEVTLRAILDPMYSYVIDDIRQSMRRATSVAISFDLWTAIEGSHYLGISYHWIDELWTQRAHILDLLHFQPSATALVLGHLVEERFDSHLPPEEVDIVLCASVSDRGANAKLARDLIVSEEESEHCVPHLVKTGLDNLTMFKEKYRSSYWKEMSTDMNALTQLLTLFNNNGANLTALRAALPPELKHLNLVFPNDTRWEGRLRMLQRAIRLRVGLDVACEREINSLRETCAGPDDFLQPAFWNRLQAYMTCYGHVNSFSQKMQGDGALKSSVLMDYINLKATLETPSDSASLTAAGSHFAAALTVCFGDLVGSVNNTTKAALLDPRNYPEVLTHMGPELVEGCWSAMREELGSYHRHEHALEVAQVAFNGLAAVIPKMDPSAAPEGQDPLLWCWREFFTDSQYEYMSPVIPMIKGILCIPASAAKCERIFSFTTRLVNRLTSSLGADTVEMKTIIKDALDKGIFTLDEFLAYVVSEKLDEDVSAMIEQLKIEFNTKESE